MHQLEEDLEEEKVRQRRIIDDLLGCKSPSNRRVKPLTPKLQLVPRYDPTSREHARFEAHETRSLVADPEDGASEDSEEEGGGSEEERGGSEEEGVGCSAAGGHLRSLFSGQQFSFLSGPAGEGEVAGGEDASSDESVGRPMVGTSDTVMPNSLFFFHWARPGLANRTEHSFHATRSRDEWERVWPERRVAMKQLLRHSHRHAVKAARQRRRTQRATV